MIADNRTSQLHPVDTPDGKYTAIAAGGRAIGARSAPIGPSPAGATTKATTASTQDRRIRPAGSTPRLPSGNSTPARSAPIGPSPAGAATTAGKANTWARRMRPQASSLPLPRATGIRVRSAPIGPSPAGAADSNCRQTLPSVSTTAITAALSYSCAIRTDQTIACWGPQ